MTKSSIHRGFVVAISNATNCCPWKGKLNKLSSHIIPRITVNQGPRNPSRVVLLIPAPLVFAATAVHICIKKKHLPVQKLIIESHNAIARLARYDDGQPGAAAGSFLHGWVSKARRVAHEEEETVNWRRSADAEDGVKPLTLHLTKQRLGCPINLH